MRIGIITYHRALNYGAALQAFSLTEHLKSKGYNAEVIDYRCPRIESDYYKLIPSKAKSFRAIISSVMKYPKKRKRAALFRKFENKQCYLSSTSYDKNSISKSNAEYDVFISGSDQVWNNYGSDSDFNYFLEFVDDSKKKIAYSASFGYKKVPEFLVEDYKRLLNRFDAISVREKSGAIIVKNLIDKNAYVTCDPVLLLDEDTWNRKIDINIEMKEPYLLCYFLAFNNAALDYATTYASKTGLKVVAINNIQKDFPGVKMLKFVSPERFVSLFANASAVITDSFHGTVFSLTFHKPFNTFVSEKSGVSSRIESLLDRLGLMSHIVSDFEKSDWTTIDYKTVNESIKAYRNSSISFLEESLKK